MILITGGAGYIGAHVNKYLHQHGYRTVVFDNLSLGHRESVLWGEFVYGDLADLAALRYCFNTFPIEAVMHFGAFAYVGESVSAPAPYYANNVSNTLNLLNTMREFAVSRIVFSSSCTTYGIPHTIPIDENHAQQPINPYGWSKVMVEQILRDYDTAYGMKHISLRYFNAAGADPDSQIGEWHDPETHLIPLVLLTALGTQAQLEIYGDTHATADGTCIRDYIHVLDLAAAHALALQALLDNCASATFNLGNGNGYSVREVIRCAEKISGKTIATAVKPKRPGDPPVLIGSAQKIMDAWQWRPQYPDLDSIVATAWNWHKKHPG